MATRLAYLDNLKVALVCGVIATHVAITYGFDGDWYLESYDPISQTAADVLTIPIGIGWLFGMGLFFLVAGRMTAPSLAWKGPRLFVRDRVARLGIPLLAYVLLISPVLEYVGYRADGGTDGLWEFFGGQVVKLGPGPMWFIEALLAFSLAYVAWVLVFPRREPPQPGPLAARHVIALAAAICLASYATHFLFPVGSEQLNLQLAVFPQYVILFAVGIAAWERGWLETLSPRLTRGCGIAVLVVVLVLPVILAAGGFFDGNEDTFEGGLHWQAFAGAAVEGLVAVCASVWTLGIFQRRFAAQGPLLRAMGRGAYMAYFLHPPVIVGLALALHRLPIPAGGKLILDLVGGIAISFGLAIALVRWRRIGELMGSWSRRPAAETAG